MIREDSISISLTVLAAMIIMYLSTYVGFGTILLIPIVLLLVGVTMQMWVARRFPTVDINLDGGGREVKQIGYYTVLCLAGIGLGSFVSAGLFRPPLTVQLSTFDQMLYGTLYGISEERFFRGFITSFLLWKTNPIFAHIGSGAIFCVYHFKVYSSSMQALVYVLIAGTLLSWVVWRTKRLSPALLAHSINNLLV